MAADVLILPTAGLNKKGLPTTHGLCRIEAVVRECRERMPRCIAIPGGKWPNGPSEAQAYYDYIVSRYPDLIEKVEKWIVDAEATCTNRDLVSVAPKIKDFLTSIDITPETAEVAVVAYPEFFERIKIVLNRLGFGNIRRVPSFEIQVNSALKESVLINVTRIDPFWRWTPVGWLFVWLASRR